MHTGEFLSFRREGTVRNYDRTWTIVDCLRRYDLLHRVVADGHVAAKLRLDNFLCIIAHDDQVAALIPRSSRELRGIAVTLVEPLYERFETAAIELSRSAARRRCAAI